MLHIHLVQMYTAGVHDTIIPVDLVPCFDIV